MKAMIQTFKITKKGNIKMRWKRKKVSKKVHLDK